MNATDNDLELLLGIAIEATAASDDAGLALAATDCLPMGMLAGVSDGTRDLLPAEQGHVEECTRCSARLRALGRAAPQAAAKQPQSVPPAGLRRLLPYFALVVGAALVVAGAILWRGEEQPEQVDTPELIAEPVPEAEACDLDVCVDEVSSTAAAAGVRSVQLQVTSAEDVVAVAILHGWDDDCQCVRSRIHQMQAEDGSMALRSTLPNGVAVSLGVEVAAGATGEQRLLLLTSPDPSALPRTDRAADLLLDCLGGAGNHETQNELSSAAQSCLAQPVCVRSVTID